MTRFKVTDQDGNEIAKGDEIKDHRGEPWIFQMVTRAPMPGKSAKVHVTYGDASREFYAEVFSLTVTVIDAE